MAVLKTQILYGWSGDPKPILIGEGDDQQKAVKADDFLYSIRTSEESVGQLVTQDNAEVQRQNDLINAAVLTELPQVSGGAVLADVITAVNSLTTQVNSIIIVLTNINSISKQ